MTTLRITTVVAAAVMMLLPASVASAADTTTTFKVTGMYCNACETKVRQALKKTDGVRSATVSLSSGSAMVIYDDAKVTPDRIIRVIETQGFKAEPQPGGKS